MPSSIGEMCVVRAEEGRHCSGVPSLISLSPSVPLCLSSVSVSVYLTIHCCISLHISLFLSYVFW